MSARHVNYLSSDICLLLSNLWFPEGISFTFYKKLYEMRVAASVPKPIE